MRLVTAHKILISIGVVFFLFFAALQWMEIRRGQGTPLAAALGLAAAVALAVYLRTLKGK